MKRLLTLVALFLCCMATSFAQFSGSGNGTEEDPYLIFNDMQLSQVSNFLNQEGVVFKLMTDLDLTKWIEESNEKQGWLPIGVDSSPFKGKFYGNNHTIKGLMINRTSTNHVGFFGYVNSATIDNLTIEGSTIVGKDYVGGFVGHVTGATITNCHITMTGSNGVKGTNHVGGFAGYSNNTNYSTFSALTSVVASWKTGGFIGTVDSGTFSEGTVTGSVVGSSDFTGGFIGHATGATLTNVGVESNVTGKDYTGGYMGNCCRGHLANCKYKGTLTGNQYVGGISGSLESTTSSFSDCFTKGKIIATGDYAGGIVGGSKGACIEKMENCRHFGDLIGQSYVGGLVGTISEVDVQPHLCEYKIYNRYVYDINRPNSVYKEKIIEGSPVNAILNNCISIGNIEGIDYVGGMIGAESLSYGYIPQNEQFKVYSITGDYQHVYKDGEFLTTTYSNYSNALIITYNNYQRNFISTSLTNSYYSGNIHGVNCVGGLVGKKNGGEIRNNYSYANIFGKTNVGGIVGYIYSKSEKYSTDAVTRIMSNVSNCQTISANISDIGRIYGFCSEETVIGALGSAEGNRALSHTKIILQGIVQEIDDNLQNGTSIGPSALKLKANYVSWGWDFDNNWNILETESYPYKKYQAAPPVIESNLVSQAMGISGKSLDGGTVYLFYKDYDVVSTTCSGNNFTFATEPLQSGALVQIYADVEGMTPSYFTSTTVGYPGSGTEDDPYRIYTAEDLQGASNRGYYKLMNDVDLTQWINKNSPTEGWPAIGRNSGEVTYIDGDGHKVMGLWIDTKESFNGLFSNFSAGQIKNLTVEVAEGKKVKGGDYTGILIGRNANGNIINCTVKGDVEGKVHTGGVAGYVEKSTVCTVSYEGNVASVTNNAYVGGLIGQSKDCELSACEAKATINTSGTSGKVGGLIGASAGGSISQSNAQPALAATGNGCQVGGLVGYSETPITTSWSGGEASASGENTYAGGLVGYAKAAVENCYSTAKTTGSQFSAGLVGYTFSKIDKCYAKGDVYGVNYGGGVVGELDGTNATITNSVACNNILSLSAQTSWGCRVIGGYKNGAADPDETNYALSTMQVSLNGLAEIKSDNLVEGKAMTQEVLMQKRTYQQLGWDLSQIWDITEGEGYPVLREKSNTGGDEEPGPGEDPTPVLTYDDNLVVPQITAHTGETTIMYINLENKTTDLTAYQFDLVLPTGITVAKNDKGKFKVTKTNRYEDEAQSLQVSLVEGTNTYRFVSFSLSNDVISETKGAILNVTLAIDANVVEGNFEGNINNIVFTKSEGTQLKLNNVSFNIVVSDMVKGDTNGDGDINVSDIVEIVNCIMGKPSSKFVAAAADMNGDGEVNVTDIVQVVSIIMAGSGASSRSDVDMATTKDNDRLLLTDGLSLRLENDGNYVAAQFDMKVSDGKTIDDISLNGERSGRHLLTYAKTGENLYKVVLYSLDNSSFSGHDGELLSIRVSGNGDVTLENILFVTSGNVEKRFAPLYGTVTGIEDTKHSTLNTQQAFDLQGRRTKATKKGVYVVNDKKYVVK